MSFLSGVLGGVGSLIGGLFGGGNSGGGKPAVAPVAQPRMPTPEEDQAIIAWWEGFQQQMSTGRQPTTSFDPVAAMMGGQQGARNAPAPLQATSNQRGGMAYPGYAGMGLMQERQPGRGAGGGDGKGAGGGSGAAYDSAGKPGSVNAQNFWHLMLSRLTAPGAMQQYTAPLQAGFTQYQQQALAGQAGLPEEAYRQALLSGQQTINAQTQQARASLGEQLGSRGLAQSGLMSRGLRGVEEARVQSIGDLISGLAQQNMQARVEAQRTAAGMMPSLISAQTGAAGDVLRAYLAQEGLDLERGRLRASNRAQQQASDDVFWGALGSVAGSLFGGGGGSSYTGIGFNF